jgi:hypothetical protein
MKDLEKQHNQLRDERRFYEKELAAIDGKIRDAINNGDIETFNVLMEQKRVLPRTFIMVSVRETNARRALLNAEDAVNVARLEAAISERDRLQGALTKLEERAGAELAEMEAAMKAAEARAGELQSLVSSNRNDGARRQAAFRNALAELAGTII